MRREGSSDMRGMFGGILAGGLVSALALGTASVVSEQPAGVLPPEAPLVDAPEVEPVADPMTAPTETPAAGGDEGPSSPVGSISIDEPQAPALPEGEAPDEPASPDASEPEAAAPRADTDPLDEPEVVAVEGAMAAPDVSEGSGVEVGELAPVFPNPQSQAPQTPNTEANLTVSTAPAQPIVVIEPEGGDVSVVEEGEEPTEEMTGEELASEEGPTEAMASDDQPEVMANEEQPEDTFVIDLGADAIGDDDPEQAGDETTTIASVSPDTEPESPAPETTGPRLQLQGGENSLLADRGTGVTIRRPGNATESEDTEPTEASGATGNALTDFAANVPDVGDKPLLSIVLIDDGSMSAAAAALSGLPFTVTIAIDPAMENAAALMDSYRADGFEVLALAKLPEGALPSDVEITFESVFGTLPESIGVLDIGEGGLQSDRAVTAQAMEILATQGRGLITASRGLNPALRAAEQANVPSAVVYRDLDVDGQDARVIRRFVDQAAFQARRESGVVLVGRVRPDTISALILWGTANQDDLVALVPVSAVLLAQ